MKLFKQWS